MRSHTTVILSIFTSKQQFLVLIYVYCEIFQAVTTRTSVAVGRPHPQPRSDLLRQDAAPTHDHVALAPRSPV